MKKRRVFSASTFPRVLYEPRELGRIQAPIAGTPALLLQVRIGLDAGELVADSNSLFGATVQVAARPCQGAEPDAIVVSQALSDLLAGRFRFVDLGS